MVFFRHFLVDSGLCQPRMPIKWGVLGKTFCGVLFCFQMRLRINGVFRFVLDCWISVWSYIIFMQITRPDI